MEQFQKNALQSKIAQPLKIPPSTEHNIIKRFRESGGVSASMGQGQRSALDVCDLRAFRRHCSGDSPLDINAWGSGTLPEISVFEHSLPYNPLMQAKAESCKEEARCEHGPEIPASSLCQSSSKMARGEMENCSVVR